METSGIRGISGAIGRAAIAVLLAGMASRAPAADEPRFRPGQWQFNRTVESPGAPAQKLSNSRCVDPGADWMVQRQKMAKLGCQVTPTVHSGSTYRFSAACHVGTVNATSSSVLTVQGPDSYTVTLDSTTGAMHTHETLSAHRLGDCTR